MKLNNLFVSEGMFNCLRAFGDLWYVEQNLLKTTLCKKVFMPRSYFPVWLLYASTLSLSFTRH